MDFIKKHSTFILDIILIFIGCFIASLGVNLFLTHAHLLSGGATGIGLIIEYLTGFQAGFTVFIVNIPLFLLSYKKHNMPLFLQLPFQLLLLLLL